MFNIIGSIKFAIYLILISSYIQPKVFMGKEGHLKEIQH